MPTGPPTDGPAARESAADGRVADSAAAPAPPWPLRPLGSADETAPALVEIEGLQVSADPPAHPWCAGWSCGVPRGASVGILGESGSGKTMTVRSLLGVLPGGVSVTGGSIRFDGHELTAGEVSWKDLHGRRIGTVFQDPAAWFTPHLTVGSQVDEVLRLHVGPAPARGARRPGGAAGPCGAA